MMGCTHGQRVLVASVCVLWDEPGRGHECVCGVQLGQGPCTQPWYTLGQVLHSWMELGLVAGTSRVTW